MEGLGSGPCRPEFENGGLRERPLTENGGLSERPLTRGIFELKITKKHIFLKRGASFGAVQVEKVESLGAQKNWGLLGGTYSYCPNMGVPPSQGKVQCWTPNGTEWAVKTSIQDLFSYIF